jgi:nucleoside-diphosphate-sugar epimerase
VIQPFLGGANRLIAVARKKQVVFGTGPVGSSIARLLQSSGYEVIAVPTSEYGSDPQGVHIFRGDPANFEFVLDACADASAIFLCLNGPPSQWAEMYPPIVDNAIQVAARTGAKLIHWDLAHVYGPTREPIDESTPNSGKTGPARVMIDMADKIINATWQRKISGAVGRSADIYGPGAIGPEFGSSFGGNFFWSALNDEKITIVGDMDAPRSMAYVDDVAQGLITLAEEPQSVGQIWHLPCDRPISPMEMVHLLANETTSTSEVGGTPRHVRGCALMQLKVVNSNINEVRHELHSLDRPFVLDHSMFTSMFGQQVTKHEEAIRQSINWYREHPRPVDETLIEKAFEKMPQVARTSRFVKRLGAGAYSLART